MKRITVPFAALLLAGCGKTVYVDRPVVTTVEVAVPVSAPCVPSTLQPATDYPDGDLPVVKGDSGPERYQNALAGRRLRIARIKELETVVAGCPKETAR